MGNVLFSKYKLSNRILYLYRILALTMFTNG